MKNIISDIKKSMDVKEKFSIIQGDENKTFFKTSDILVTNNQIDNRFNQFTFERVIDQIQFDLPTTSPNLIPVGEDNSSYVNLDDIFEEYLLTFLVIYI